MVEYGLGALFGFAVIATLMLAIWVSPFASLAVPVLFGAMVLLPRVLGAPVIGLAVLMTMFFVVLKAEDGVGLTDLLFIAYYLPFLFVWFLPRFPDWKHHIRSGQDVSLTLFILLVLVTAPLAFVLGGKTSEIATQLFALSVVSLYFPIRETCVRKANGTVIMTGALLGVVLLAALRNLYQYQEIILSAQQAWQFTTARVYVNDNYMMTGAVIGIVMTLFAHRVIYKVGFALLFSVSFVALVMTQSRGFWVAFLVGAAVIFFMVDHRRKVQMVVAGLTTAVVVGIMAVFWLSDFLPLIVAGLTDRFGSLGTATQADVSLVNRFMESRAVWEKIKLNPVVGYGVSVPFSFYDITFDATMRGTFIHSGYLSLWYRFGIFGLGAVLFFWASAVWKGLSTFRLKNARISLRASGLATAAVLIAYVLPAQTSNPFVLIDGIFLMTALCAIAAGARERAAIESEVPDIK